MKYKAGDVVLYSAHGVCKVAELAKKNMSGKIMEYYVLKPVGDSKFTILVPVDSERLTAKMRRLLSAGEIYALIRTMPGENTIWIDDEKVRRARYKEILALGDRAELVQLIKTLYLRQRDMQKKGKRLYLADGYVMRDAEKMLYDEFAHVLEINPDQVLPFIMERIETAE
ncbi:MAG: CarD family transcriptional regulator [Oscillospiraceae bacterium]|jgi:CarD family transcriptional regulator|nr:CarD family transcriptional regulator [Oscillospiraceae bacterium]